MLEEPIDLSGKTTTELATLWLHQKQAEAMAYTLKILVEQEIFSRLETEKNRVGLKTFEVGNYDIKIKRGVNWSCPEPAQLEMLFEHSESVPYTKRLTVSDSRMRILSVNNPSLYKEACAHLVAKPAKPNFNIILLKD